MTRLRVALETQFAVGTPTGLGVYASGLAKALRARDDVEVVELRDDSFDLWRFDRRLYWDQVRAPALAARAKADVVHFTGGTLPLRLTHPTILTLHDLVWVRGVNRGRFYVRWYFGDLQRRLARRADAILVDTEAARVDVADGLDIDAARIHVVGVGVDDSFFHIERRVDDPPFILCVGTVERRKDLVTAVEAVARIPDVRLVSVGPLTPYADEVRARAARLDVSNRIDLRGYVDHATLRDLYSRAAALVFPSRYEGFGLPPLQALACGLPVVAARIPVTEEVLGDSPVYVEPGDDIGFAVALSSVTSSSDARRAEAGRRQAQTFIWPTVADSIVRCYRATTRNVGA
ncbi:MAG TPA: glycosyltransferase family 1 protein [Candidatus Eremiobacteraceae bacterium]|nr:glycosyltransferase family 1 protein [Candidatus Eremiobacteraceae bacterium]